MYHFLCIYYSINSIRHSTMYNLLPQSHMSHMLMNSTYTFLYFYLLIPLYLILSNMMLILALYLGLTNMFLIAMGIEGILHMHSKMYPICIEYKFPNLNKLSNLLGKLNLLEELCRRLETIGDSFS